MQLRNTNTQFGTITKFLHWAIALLVGIQFYLVYWKEWMLPEHSPLADFYINGLHKPIGALVLLFTIMAILWKFTNPRPQYPLTMHTWEKQNAWFVQTILYLTLLVIPVSGLIMSVAAGYPPNFFGWYQVPQFIEKSQTIAEVGFEIHKTTSFVIIALVVIHTLAAIKHHFIDKDNVLLRMLP